MARYQSRDAEDYSRGSSDKPISGYQPAKGFPKLTHLDKKMTRVNVKHLKPDRTLDVERTNAERLSYARQHLRPVVRVKYVTHYRVVETDGDGLISVRYSDTMPERMRAISDDEKIPISVAAELLRVSEDDVLRKINSDELKGTDKTVNLKYLDAYKFSE